MLDSETFETYSNELFKAQKKTDRLEKKLNKAANGAGGDYGKILVELEKAWANESEILQNYADAVRASKTT